MSYIKKIAIDLRFLKINDNYSDFIINLTKIIIQNNNNYFFEIFTNKNFWNYFNFWNSQTKLFKNGFIKDNLNFWNFLNKNNFDFAIFFSSKSPIFYKKKYILFVETLANIHFPNNQNVIRKYLDNFFFTKNIKKATKICVFNEITKDEINDKYNIFEWNIEIINWAFLKKELEKQENLSDLRIKYNIKWDFYIYSAWAWNDKNLWKLIEVFKKIEKNLLILDEETIKDVNFRKKVINENLINKIFFIWETNLFEKDFFYRNSLWVLYPVLYSNFPFYLNDALNYNKEIFASNLKIIKNIFENKISYFNPNNTEDFIKTLETKKGENIDYDDIFTKYNIEKSSINLNKIIKSL